MASFDAIDSVAVDPDYCHRCGAAVDAQEYEGRTHPWCPECNVLFSQCPIPGGHVVVRDDDSVLVLDEPVPQHEGVMSLPGGHAKPAEQPRESVVRELEEETGLTADPEDLEFLTVVHSEHPDVAFYLLTYAVERSRVDGDLEPEFEDGDAYFAPVAELRANPDRIRDSDLDRIELAFGE